MLKLSSGKADVELLTPASQLVAVLLLLVLSLSFELLSLLVLTNSVFMSGMTPNERSRVSI